MIPVPLDFILGDGLVDLIIDSRHRGPIHARDVLLPVHVAQQLDPCHSRHGAVLARLDPGLDQAELLGEVLGFAADRNERKVRDETRVVLTR